MIPPIGRFDLTVVGRSRWTDRNVQKKFPALEVPTSTRLGAIPNRHVLAPKEELAMKTIRFLPSLIPNTGATLVVRINKLTKPRVTAVRLRPLIVNAAPVEKTKSLSFGATRVGCGITEPKGDAKPLVRKNIGNGESRTRTTKTHPPTTHAYRTHLPLCLGEKWIGLPHRLRSPSTLLPNLPIIDLHLGRLQRPRTLDGLVRRLHSLY